MRLFQISIFAALLLALSLTGSASALSGNALNPEQARFDTIKALPSSQDDPSLPGVTLSSLQAGPLFHGQGLKENLRESTGETALRRKHAPQKTRPQWLPSPNNTSFRPSEAE